MGQDGCPELEAEQVWQELALEGELGLAGSLGPRAGDRGELDSPAFKTLRADEDASETTRRPGGGLCAFAAAVQKQVVGAAWGEEMGSRWSLEDSPCAASVLRASE